MRKERRSKYPPEYKRRMVDLVRAGRTIPSLAAEYRVHYTTIVNWVTAADAAATRNLEAGRPGDQTELRRLRQRVAELEEEREILKKPRPGSHRKRLVRRRGVPVREGEPGRARDLDDVPSARGISQWLLRVAAPRAV